MDYLDEKVLNLFSGIIVRKDLTTYMKRGANVPGFVIEYLLGMYCNNRDEKAVSEGLKKISDALSRNYIKPNEVELIKSKIKEKGLYTIIDCLSVRLDEKNDIYFGKFSNFKIPEIVIDPELVKSYPKLLTGGMWGFIGLAYNPYNFNSSDEEDTSAINEEKEIEEKINNVKYAEDNVEAKNVVKNYLQKHSDELLVKKKDRNDRRGSFYFTRCPFILERIKPIQLAGFDFAKLIEKRKEFTLDEWMTFILRCVGIESSALNVKEKLHYIERIVPLFERNYNLVELGPRGTGKSYIYKEISPHSLLVSGGNASSSSLFYNVSRKKVGMVGNWDCVAFDEVTGKALKDEIVIQILKDYMASGSFSRGDAFISADASLVFIGNINDSVENLLRVSHLFSDFSGSVANDSAFFDRIHYYLPGWEIPKLNNSLLTTNYGLISDCFAEFAQYMRKFDFGNDFDKYFKLNKSVNTRDEIAIRKTMSGLSKILFPDHEYNESDMRIVLNYAIEGRTRVKMQLKKISGEEFSNIDLGYIDSHGVSTIVGVPEKPVDSIIPNAKLKAGHVFTAGTSIRDKIPSLFKMEVTSTIGEGNLITQGVQSSYSLKMAESIKAGWYQFKEKVALFTKNANIPSHDYMFYLNDIQNRSASKDLNVALFIALISHAKEQPVKNSLAVLGSISLTGSFERDHRIVDNIRCAYHAGAKTILVSHVNKDLIDQCEEVFIKEINIVYYKNLEEAVAASFGD